MTDKEAKEKMRDIFQNYSFEVIKGVFITLDLLLSHCNSFEDFKVGIRKTVDNLTEEDYKNDR